MCPYFFDGAGGGGTGLAARRLAGTGSNVPAHPSLAYVVMYLAVRLTESAMRKGCNLSATVPLV
jgi:hypothetical protein